MSNDIQPADQVAALVGIYQAERSECSSIPNVGLALVGSGAAYMAGTLAFIGSFHSLGWLVVAVLPLPLWLVSSYHSLLLGKAVVHAQSTRLVEEKLARIAGLRPDERVRVGTYAGSSVMNWRRANVPHRLANIVTYVGMFLIIVGYTVFMLVLSSHNGGGSWIWFFSVCYGVLVFLVGWSWLAAVDKVRPVDLSR